METSGSDWVSQEACFIFEPIGLKKSAMRPRARSRHCFGIIMVVFGSRVHKMDWEGSTSHARLQLRCEDMAATMACPVIRSGALSKITAETSTWARRVASTG